MLTVREALSKFLKLFGGDVDEGTGYLTVALKGGAGFEKPIYAWKMLDLGKRWNVAYYYTTAVGAGATINSASWVVQDNSLNNYTYFRAVFKNAGSTNMTYKVQQSIDNSTWYDLPNQSVNFTSDGVQTLEGEVFMPYMRVSMVNADTTNAQTANLVYLTLI